MKPDLLYLQKLFTSPGKWDLLEMEANYQQLIKKFSPAYLAGSKWYVGPSLLDYFKNQPIDRGVFSILCYMSHRPGLS